MARLLLLLCSIAINVIILAEGQKVYPRRFYHDYAKDGRVLDGPFPSSLKNIPYYCYQVPSKGPCERMFVVYFYDVVTRKCSPMMYSGCGGNENRFNSKASCVMHCESKRGI